MCVRRTDQSWGENYRKEDVQQKKMEGGGGGSITPSVIRHWKTLKKVGPFPLWDLYPFPWGRQKKKACWGAKLGSLKQGTIRRRVSQNRGNIFMAQFLQAPEGCSLERRLKTHDVSASLGRR